MRRIQNGIFFFFARANSAHNLYYRGLEVIGQALEQQLLRHADWKFYFVGTDLTSIKLPGGATPEFAQNLDWNDYAQLVRKADVGLALNLTPHPGQQTLELAASGAVVVTNKFANKISLDTYSSNIICAEPSVEPLVHAIGKAAALSKQMDLRASNYAANSISGSWQASFTPLFKELLHS